MLNTYLFSLCAFAPWWLNSYDSGKRSMSESDITQIKIDGQSVGIIGLTNVMEEMAEVYAEKSDDEIKTELLNRLTQRNYIPDHAKKKYGQALVREFRKFLGQPYEEGSLGGLEIIVLGPGCAQCDRLEKEVMEILSEMNLAAEMKHERDIKEIGRYGVMGMPALLINGEVMSVGKVPPKEKMKEWLKKAQERR